MKAWKAILIILLTSATCFFAGYRYKGRQTVKPMSDTIVVRDTLRDSIPYPVIETGLMEVPEPFPVYITISGDTVRDTIYVPVPITQKEYRTEDYRAWVSGYRPSLDSVWVYPKTERIYIREKQRRWGLGVIAGYGIGKNGLSPYVGVGGFYRIW